MQESVHESAVWDRVTAASRNAAEKAPAPAPIGPELLSALERQQVIRQQYLSLRSRTGGEFRQSTQEVLRRNQAQIRTLSALYFYLNGRRPALTPASPAGTTREPAVESIRRLLREEELSMGRLESLAARSTGETRETLLLLSRQCRLQFQALLTLLGRALEQ
ncbi:MAG: hypothetical protein IJ206_08640 [Oscillospiraceae bacterium]|nr:hypothetical protein [Oscillospiraceae bacterium]